MIERENNKQNRSRQKDNFQILNVTLRFKIGKSYLPPKLIFVSTQSGQKEKTRVRT